MLSGSSEAEKASAMIPIVGPAAFVLYVLSALASMPPSWSAWVAEGASHIEAIKPSGFRGYMDGGAVYLDWPPDDDPSVTAAGTIVHEAQHAYDWRACIVLGGGISEARANYREYLYYRAVRDQERADYWYTVFLVSPWVREIPQRAIRWDCTVAYDPLTGQPTRMPAWKLWPR